MKNYFKFIILVFQFLIMGSSFGQTLKGKDIIISCLVPDNILGRYNLGIEYFLPSKDSVNFLSSIMINGGKTNATLLGKRIEGVDFTAEINVYGEVLLKRKWNEYVGLKLSGGRFKNETTMENKNFFFIGIGTGIQPIIAKRIAVRLSSDVGYMRNGLSETLLFNDGSDPFNSGFTVIFNLGIGIKF